MIDLVGVIWLLVYNLQKRETLHKCLCRIWILLLRMCIAFLVLHLPAKVPRKRHSREPCYNSFWIFEHPLMFSHNHGNRKWLYLKGNYILMEGHIYHWTKHWRKGNHDLTSFSFPAKKPTIQSFSLEFGSHFRSTPSIRYDRGNPMQKIRSQIAKIFTNLRCQSRIWTAILAQKKKKGENDEVATHTLETDK